VLNQQICPIRKRDLAYHLLQSYQVVGEWLWVTPGYLCPTWRKSLRANKGKKMKYLRTFMYIQKRAYAVSCAMQVVQPVMPQGHPGEDVKPVACGVLREHTQGELYVALENPREAALLVR